MYKAGTGWVASVMSLTSPVVLLVKLPVGAMSVTPPLATPLPLGRIRPAGL